MRAFIAIFAFMFLFGVAHSQMVSIEFDTITKIDSNINGATTFVKIDSTKFMAIDSVFIIDYLFFRDYNYALAVGDFGKKFLLSVRYEEYLTFKLEKKCKLFSKKEGSFYIGSYKIEYILLFKSCKDRKFFKKEMKKSKRNIIFGKKPRKSKASP